MVAEGQVATRTVKLKRPNTEKDIVSTSDQVKPRKRARVDRENVTSTRKKPARNKKGISATKPESSRVRKTYRRRQKTERSSPGHSANRDIDYDEVPPATVQLNASANERDSPTTKIVDTVPISRALRMKGKNEKVTSPELPVPRTKPTVEVPNNEESASNGKLEPCDPRAQIQCPPTTSALEDDDTIQSFSPSPRSPPLMPVDMTKVITGLHLSLSDLLILSNSLHSKSEPLAMLVSSPVLYLELSLIQSESR